MLLTDKIFAITGGASGIGRAAALEAARHGADIAITDIAPVEAAAPLLREIESLGRRALYVQGDVSKPETAGAFMAAIKEELGGLDVFVSNAGICPFHGFLDLPKEILTKTVEVNLLGAFYMVQAAARMMVDEGRGGSIIAVSSISALVGGEFQTHYTPTKAGVLSLMQSTAIALGRHDIRCNAILPGTIRTAINHDDLSDPTKAEAMMARIPLGRFGEAEDLAGPIVFLGSSMASYITGASLLVDGGCFVNLQ
ncbi:SDR family NAD(P)-dependent oxidoreductase [Asaia krungthepensis]|uniref:Dehydrogenase n=1 Tax=Asaia krungthepensis NRIC 0535 TaxID=1307925 RepID=A0ABQ0PX62_9PROT|nr:SDR family NAD(P)-dependent oxidoreductase [Asaia krungthepensis]GBQ83814.1 dehydrogenase [Asaia krungthepensis NRIC 0535]